MQCMFDSLITDLDSDAADARPLASHIGEQNVLGLEVAVDDALAVEDAHGGGDLLQEDPQRVLAQGSLGWGGDRLYPSNRVF